jgi:hypothetical protein
MQRQFFLLAAREDGAADPALLVAETPQLDARARMDIYANMFIWRQVDALRDDFPQLAERLGGDFYAFAEAYLREHPSTRPSLSELGAQLPAFALRRRPELAQLAALEWARARVFEEPDLPYLERLPPVAEADLPLVRLRFVPALRLLENAVVWKKDFEVFHAPIDQAEARALSLAMAGEPLGAVCEAFDGVEAAFRAISSWFAEGFVREAA